MFLARVVFWWFVLSQVGWKSNCAFDYEIRYFLVCSFHGQTVN